MVYWSDEAHEDIERIFEDLLHWRTPNGQVHMDYAHAVAYYTELYDRFETIDQLHVHQKPKYASHARHGQYAYQYNRNDRTTWYAIYDLHGTDVFLKKILSNYNTKEAPYAPADAEDPMKVRRRRRRK